MIQELRMKNEEMEEKNEAMSKMIEKIEQKSSAEEKFKFD
jgi:hypothetical protein